MSIGLKSDSSGTSGSIVINGSDAVLVTPTEIVGNTPEEIKSVWPDILK